MKQGRNPCCERALLLAEEGKRSTTGCEDWRRMGECSEKEDVLSCFPLHHQHAGDHQADADILVPGEGHTF